MVQCFITVSLSADTCQFTDADPADSPWGRAYQRKKSQGHSVYGYADFMTIESTIAQQFDFKIKNSAGTLFWNPDELPPTSPAVEQGISELAGFAALLFYKVS